MCNQTWSWSVCPCEKWDGRRYINCENLAADTGNTEQVGDVHALDEHNECLAYHTTGSCSDRQAAQARDTSAAQDGSGLDFRQREELYVGHILWFKVAGKYPCAKCYDAMTAPAARRSWTLPRLRDDVVAGQALDG